MFSDARALTVSAVLSIFFLFLLFQPIYAVSLSIDNIPASVDQSEEFTVAVALGCTGCSDSYLRGVFYPSGTNYFGYTQNNLGQWIGTTSDRTQYFKISESDLREGSWSGTIRVKPDPDDSAYSGPGTYSFKVARYTAGGSTTWSNDVSLGISGPTPTTIPSRTPTSTPLSTPTHTPTPQSTTNTMRASSPTAVVAKPSSTRRTTSTDAATPFEAVPTTIDVLGNSIAVPPSQGVSSRSGLLAGPIFISLLLIGLGLALISVALALHIRSKRLLFEKEDTARY